MSEPPAATQPLEPDSDGGSTYSASISDGASLVSSIMNHKYENGRRYHAFREGSYMLPNDETELDRLDMVHHVFRMCLNGELTRVPAGELKSARILDVGCGSGSWSIDMADELPESQVVGIDLSPVQSSWVPQNCSFYVDDVEEPWNFRAEDKFDYIHIRSMGGAIKDWPKLYAQAYENLKDGGYIEVQEYQGQTLSEDGTHEQAVHLQAWANDLNKAMEAFGKPLKVAHRHKQWVIDAGFENVKEEMFKLPVGPWPKGKKNKEMGIYYLVNYLEALEPFSLALFTRVLGYSTEKCKQMCADATADLKNANLHMYVPYFFVWGRKGAKKA